jgi:5-methyltetrahydropteroyltriglutamate--homocysteine methyltransferase
MNRPVLSRLGITLPLLPTTSVGSLPKPPELLAARRRYTTGAISRRELDTLAEEATVFWLRQQETLGLDVLVDGEMYRSDPVGFFAEELDGMALGGLVRVYGNRYYRKPVITGPIRWEQPVTVGWWRFAQGHTAKPIKATVTGPYTLMDWSFDEHYGDRRAACLALAHELRKELEALVAAGARIIQIDEPALSARADELPLVREALRVMTDELDAYWIVHTCYGAFDTIYPGMLGLPVHSFSLALAHAAVDWIAHFAAAPFTADLCAGVIDVHAHTSESVDSIRQRIEHALPLVPAAGVWVAPDCGLRTRRVEDAIEKLRVMVAGAALARDRHDSGGSEI